MAFLRALLVCCLFAAVAVVARADEPAIGDIIGDLRFKDIRSLNRSLRDLGENKAVVLVFTNTTCPIVQKSWPRLVRMEEAFRPQEVQFVGVNVGPGDEIAEIAQ